MQRLHFAIPLLALVLIGADECVQPTRVLRGTLTAESDQVVPDEHIRIALIAVNPNDRPLEDWDAGMAWRTHVVQELLPGDGAPFRFELPLRVPADQMIQTDAGDWIAPFMLAAWVDSDEDEAIDRDETLVGASGTMILYAEDPLSPVAVQIGISPGWNVYQIDPDGKHQSAMPLTTLWTHELPANLLPHQPGDIDGTVARAMAYPDLRVGLIATGKTLPNWRTLTSVAIRNDEQPMAFRFMGPLPEPMAWHYAPGPAATRVADYRVALFADLNHDGRLNVLEPMIARSDWPWWYGTRYRYTEAGDITDGLYADWNDVKMGWTRVDLQGNETAWDRDLVLR